MKARITLGSTWVGTSSETIEIEVADQEEYDSDEFSTVIFNAIINRDFPHYYIDCELIDDEGNEVDEW